MVIGEGGEGGREMNEEEEDAFVCGCVRPIFPFLALLPRTLYLLPPTSHPRSAHPSLCPAISTAELFQLMVGSGLSPTLSETEQMT